MNHTRNSTVDILRGIAMLMVVLGHTMTGCTENSQDSFLFNIIWTLQMPLFILISGYVTRYSKPITSGKTYGKFVWKRTFAYLLPWIIWTFVVRGLIFGQSSFLNVKYVLFNMDSGYWFLFTLWTIVMIYGLGEFLSELFCKGKSEIAKFVVLTTVYLLGMAALVTIGVAVGLSFICIKLTLYYMPFYFAGALFGKLQNWLLSRKAGNTIVEIAVAVCLVAWITLMQRYSFYSIDDNGFGIALRAVTSLCGCIAVCGLTSKLFANKPETEKIRGGGVLLCNIGVHSLEIYLIHYLLLSMVKSNAAPCFATPMGIALTVMNFALTVVIAYVITRLFNLNRLLSMILFGKKC